MATNVLGPDVRGDGARQVRGPRGLTDTWFKDCVGGDPLTGTALEADFFNDLIAQIRAMLVQGGVDLATYTDDWFAQCLQKDKFHYFVPGGTANALTIDASPNFTALAQLVGVPLRIKLAAAPGAGGMTLAVDGLAATAIQLADGSAVAQGEFPSGFILHLVFDGTVFRVIAMASRARVNGQVFTASGDFTVPAGVTKVKVQVWAGGAGGGGSAVAGGGGGGGGAGEYRMGWLDVVPGTVIPVTVGAGGAGGATTPTNGSNGTASSFGALIVCNPGALGQLGNSTLGTPGNGGTGGSGGVLNSAGRKGTFGTQFPSVGWTGGLGGAAFGGGYTHWTMNNEGADGLFPGGGGGGGATAKGGAGAAGLVMVEWD